MTNEEWPKEWDSIVNKSGDESGEVSYTSFNVTWTELNGAARLYKGTMYLNIDAGQETEENIDLWSPLDVYIKNEIDKQCNQ